MKNKFVHYFNIGIFCSLYFLVATISMINSVAFFDLSHNGIMSWALAVGFELGAAASLAAIIILDKTNKTMVWTLFLLLTGFQMMANSFHAFINLENYMPWIELFGLEEAEPIFQKRILSIVSGAVLPIVALGFIKSLVDYIRPDQPTKELAETLPVEQPTESPSEPQIVKEVQPEPKPEPVQPPRVERKEVSQANVTQDSLPVIDAKTGNVIIEPKVANAVKHYNPKP